MSHTGYVSEHVAGGTCDGSHRLCGRTSTVHGALDSLHARLVLILYEKSFNLKTISQGDFGHFGEKNLIILSKVAKIALRDYF